MENKYTKHSSGPWRAVREMEQFDGSTYHGEMDDEELAEFQKRNYVRVIDQNNTNIVTNHDLFEFDNKYDAFLIAAAPDLLAALEACLNDDAGNLQPATVHMAMEAIKKAKGE